MRVFLALAGVMLYAGLGDNVHELIPLMLGVIAAAIAVQPPACLPVATSDTDSRLVDKKYRYKVVF